jgi:dienelactone hydrolase
MTTLLLFHHAQGRTEGFLAFADELRDAGHTVHTPDLYEGKAFEDPSLSDYDEEAAGLLKERTLTFLERVG